MSAPASSLLSRSLDDIIADRERPRSQAKDKDGERSLGQARAGRGGASKPSRARSPRRRGDGPIASRIHAGASTSATRVFVGNLNWDTRESDLRAHMASAGRVKDVRMMTNKQGRPSGGAIVEFEEEHSAAKAISDLYDTELDGRKLIVREDREAADAGAGAGGHSGHGDRRRAGRDEGPRRGGREERRDDRREDRRDDRGRGAPAGREERHPHGGEGSGHPHGGHSAVYDASRGGVFKVFVAGLPYKVDWRDLKDTFKPVGEVTHANVGTTPDGRSAGYGIVEFSDAKGAAAAVREFDNTLMLGRAISVRLMRE